MNTVIQLVQHLRPGGIETMALDLASFASSSDTTYIVSLEGEHDSALAAWPRLAAHAERLYFMHKRAGWQPALIRRLRGLFQHLQADAVHTHHIGPLLYGGLAARLAGIRHLTHTEHDAWHLDAPRRRWLQRAAIALTRPTLVADANSVAAAMHRHLGRRDIRVVRNGIDTARFKPGNARLARQWLGLPTGVPLVGCAGRLEQVKGQQVLIEALAMLPPDTHLALAGSGGNEAQLRALTRHHGIDQRVHFLGRIDDMPTFYQALDLFCLPSLNEGFPLSPLEAQACQIPAVVSDVGGARETLCPASGRLVPPGDAGRLAESLQQMLRSQRHFQPRDFVREQCDVRQMADAYASLRAGA